ncbi:hypothetical protein BT93_H3712 [Corymbia citriodora subsp. variegata]|nr:hypothetical protein BT93_H3712 [Corymbia citriodora subsp. variegata]
MRLSLGNLGAWVLCSCSRFCDWSFKSADCVTRRRSMRFIKTALFCQLFHWPCYRNRSFVSFTCLASIDRSKVVTPLFLLM